MTEDRIEQFKVKFRDAWDKVKIEEGLLSALHPNIPNLHEIKDTVQRVQKNGDTMIITPVKFSNLYLVREKFERKYLHENIPSEIHFCDTCVYLKDGTFLGYLRNDNKTVSLNGETEEMNKDIEDNATKDVIKDMKSVDKNEVLKNVIMKVVCLEPKFIIDHPEVFYGFEDYQYNRVFGTEFYNDCVNYTGEIFNKVASHLFEYNVGMDKPVESDEQELFMTKVDEKTEKIKETISDPTYRKSISQDGGKTTQD